LAIGLFQPAIADDTLKGGYKVAENSHHNEGGQDQSGRDWTKDVVGSASPRSPAAAENSHHNNSGQDQSGRDWTKDVVGSASPRSPAAAENSHHNEGGQDQSGRDWSTGKY